MRRGGGVAGAEECTQRPLPSPLTPPSLPSQPPASGVRQWKIPRAQPSAEMVENRGGRTMTALKKKREIVVKSETAFFFHLCISFTSGKVGELLAMSILGRDSRTTDTTS